MNRTLNVIRMQLVNRQTFIWIPLIILGGSFVISVAIWGVLAGSGVTVNMYGGGAQAPLWYFAVVGAQALTLTFPFSQAMSVTRREFYLGTLLTAIATSVMLSVIFVLGGLVESATNGWGINGYFFALDWIWASGPLGAGLFFFVLAMLFFTVGFTGATVVKRFGTLWLILGIIAVVLLLLGGLWLIGRANAWGEFFGWFAEVGAVGLTGMLAVIAVVLAAAAFPMLRRTTA